jgi:hypothetical protein
MIQNQWYNKQYTQVLIFIGLGIDILLMNTTVYAATLVVKSVMLLWWSRHKSCPSKQISKGWTKQARRGPIKSFLLASWFKLSIADCRRCPTKDSPATYATLRGFFATIWAQNGNWHGAWGDPAQSEGVLMGQRAVSCLNIFLYLLDVKRWATHAASWAHVRCIKMRYTCSVLSTC